MIIYIDADACPVQQETIQIAKLEHIQVVLVKSYSHFSVAHYPSHVDTIYVDKGRDMADLKIVQLATTNDIVITQDYGLATLCLQKGCHVLHHNGFQFNERNIEQLLAARHASAMARRAGKRTKGPKAFSDEKRAKFIQLLKEIIRVNK